MDSIHLTSSVPAVPSIGQKGQDILAHLHKGIRLENLRTLECVADVLKLPTEPGLHNMDDIRFIKCLPDTLISRHDYLRDRDRDPITNSTCLKLRTINQNRTRAIYAGGSVIHSTYTDIDVFIIASSAEDALQTIREFATLLYSDDPDTYMCLNNCLNIFSVFTLYQIVLKYFASPEHVINSFDINACMAYSDGTNTYANTACAFAIMYGTIIPDFTKVRISFISRIIKYIRKYAFNIYTGGSYLRKSTIDDIQSIKKAYNGGIDHWMFKGPLTISIANRHTYGVLIRLEELMSCPLGTLFYQREHTENYIRSILKDLNAAQKVFSPEEYAFYFMQLRNTTSIDEVVAIAIKTYKPIKLKIIDYATMSDVSDDGSILLTHDKDDSCEIW